MTATLFPETKKVRTLSNWVNGEAEESLVEKSLEVVSPLNGELIAYVPLSTKKELDLVVTSAKEAQKEWGKTPVKERVQVLFRFKQILEDRLEDIAAVIHKENGKTISEAKAELLKGIECVEYATSLPQLSGGESLYVSTAVACKMVREPLGVVAGITPFNFPAMIPLWLIPLAIGLGNAFILKPSEQTPITSIEIAKIIKEAGLPDAIFSVIHGDKNIVESLCDHMHVQAVAFVGSTPIAKNIYSRASEQGKRVRCMGGAKNHLTVVPDADKEMAANDIVASVTGCAGQRCMAASVLLAVGEVDPIIDLVVEKMKKIVPGKQMGPLISATAKQRVSSYLRRCESGGAKLILDGRKTLSEGEELGYYIGPSIIDRVPPGHEAVLDEIFGPVLAIIRVDTLEEAIEIENRNPYGNAAAIYTTSGGIADRYQRAVNAGMVGVNIGVPVPREPFSFGGWNLSRFGDGDITGASGLEFWSRAKKVTTKWYAKNSSSWMS